jgi:hypothetical protein
MRADHVPVGPLREAFDRSGVGATELARQLGWFDHRGFADGQRVRRVLGIAPTPGRRGPQWRREVRHRTALRFASVLGLGAGEVEL